MKLRRIGTLLLFVLALGACGRRSLGAGVHDGSATGGDFSGGSDGSPPGLDSTFVPEPDADLAPIPCGDSGQPCCGGNVCGGGGCCVVGQCVGSGQKCGALDAKCVSGSCETPSGPCGGVGQPCCGDRKLCTSPSTACAPDGTCIACGAENQNCCPALVPSPGTCPDGLTCTPMHECKRCGGAGEACCTGDTCAGGGCCNAGTCIAEGEACVTINRTSGGTCKAGACTGCGQRDQLCCSTASTKACGAGAACGGDHMCVSCGGVGEPCCMNSSSALCHGPNNECQFPSNICGQCGGPGQPCCSGRACGGGGCCVGPYLGTCLNSGAQCPGQDGMCSGGSCSACGRVGQPCCNGNLCVGKAACSVQEGRCVAECGAPGEPCCSGGSCNDGGCCTHSNGNSSVCVASGQSCGVDGTCSAGSCGACGGVGQACCGGFDPGQAAPHCTSPLTMCGWTGVPEKDNLTCWPCGARGLPCCEVICADGSTCINDICH
jgi:hypothetical protein